MKMFEMHRGNDESGVSGTGKVLEGAIYSHGEVVVYWVASDYHSFGFYKNFFEFYAIHIRSHPTNKTSLMFHDDAFNPVKRERRSTCRHCKNAYADHPKDVQYEDSGFRRSCSGNLVELSK